MREAATVVIIRGSDQEREVLMVKRSHDSPAFPGQWAFPGGVVSTDDHHVGGEVLRVAAVREVREECGIDLDPAQLRELSQWAPPESAKRRFLTTFFCAEDHDAQPEIDSFEVVDYAWIRPADALRRHANDEWDFMPPTWVTLAHFRQREPVPRRFHSVVVASRPTVLAWEGDAAYPGAPTNERGTHRLTLGERPWRYDYDPRIAPLGKKESLI